MSIEERIMRFGKARVYMTYDKETLLIEIVRFGTILSSIADTIEIEYAQSKISLKNNESADLKSENLYLEYLDEKEEWIGLKYPDDFIIGKKKAIQIQ